MLRLPRTFPGRCEQATAEGGLHALLGSKPSEPGGGHHGSAAGTGRDRVHARDEEHGADGAGCIEHLRRCSLPTSWPIASFPSEQLGGALEQVIPRLWQSIRGNLENEIQGPRIAQQRHEASLAHCIQQLGPVQAFGLGQFSDLAVVERKEPGHQQAGRRAVPQQRRAALTDPVHGAAGQPEPRLPKVIQACGECG